MTDKPQYRPLDVSRNEIRLVHLAPSRSFSAKLSCTLLYRSLDDNISFEALSYAWGSTSLERSISLGGRKFLITRNLEIALRHLRYVYDDRFLWIDALCINQEDVAERNEQVLKMRQIYQRAMKVVAWLGAATEDSNIGINFLVEASSRQLEISHWLREVLRDQDYGNRWKALCDILDRDYWKRVWIVQEVFFGDPVVVRCGFRCIRWSDFVFLPYNFMETLALLTEVGGSSIKLRGMPDAFLEPPAIASRMYVPASIERSIRNPAEFWADSMHLEALLRSSRHLLSSDPRDKVFGVVGMAQQYDDQRVLKVDYSLSTRQTYINTVRSLIERRKVSKLPPLGILSESFPYLSDGTLPSWVPDWSVSPKIVIPSILFNASGISHSEASFEIEDGVLIVQGLEVGTIDHLPVNYLSAKLGAFPDLRDGHRARDCIPLVSVFLEAVFAAYKLVMSTSKHLPRCQRSLDVRREEFIRTMIANHAWPTDGFAFVSEETVQEFCHWIMGCPTSGDAWDDAGTVFIRDLHPLLRPAIIRNMTQYQFCILSRGFFLMAPMEARRGDLICVLFGCNMPVVLRKIEENSYIFIGDSYVHGIMQGESVVDLAAEKRTVIEFRIH